MNLQVSVRVSFLLIHIMAQKEKLFSKSINVMLFREVLITVFMAFI